MDESRGRRLRDLLAVFGTLGAIGFGGPAAHVALIRREVVERRRWMTDAELADLIAATNVLPGPNSTELAMLVGRLRAGIGGLFVAGVAFITPAAVIVLALAWTYVEYGATPTGDAILYGVKPVMLAIVVAALWPLARAVIRGPIATIVATGVGVLWLFGVNELALLAGGATAVAAARRVPTGWMATGLVASLGVAGTTTAAVSLPLLGAVFLKAGALLFGSGYVLLAFLRGDLVERLGWLTDAQLLDAIAIGQVTPGPLFTTATFVGYLVAGVPGALVATVAIFLPAFVLAALVGPMIGHLRDRRLTAALLDGLIAASIGLMAAVSISLAATALVDPLSATIAIATGIALLWGHIPSPVLVAAGATVGLAAGAIGAVPA